MIPPCGGIGPLASCVALFDSSPTNGKCRPVHCQRYCPQLSKHGLTNNEMLCFPVRRT